MRQLPGSSNSTLSHLEHNQRDLKSSTRFAGPAREPSGRASLAIQLFTDRVLFRSHAGSVCAAAAPALGTPLLWPQANGVPPPFLYYSAEKPSLTILLKPTLLLFSHQVTSESLPPNGLQHPRLPRPSPFPRVCSNSCSLST